jgi:hypothetical protein
VSPHDGQPGDLAEHIAREGQQFLALIEERDLERVPSDLRARLALRGSVLAGSRRVFVVALAR